MQTFKAGRCPLLAGKGASKNGGFREKVKRGPMPGGGGGGPIAPEVGKVQ